MLIGYCSNKLLVGNSTLPLSDWTPWKHPPTISNELRKFNELHAASAVVQDSQGCTVHCIDRVDIDKCAFVRSSPARLTPHCLVRKTSKPKALVGVSMNVFDVGNRGLSFSQTTNILSVENLTNFRSSDVGCIPNPTSNCCSLELFGRSISGRALNKLDAPINPVLTSLTYLQPSHIKSDEQRTTVSGTVAASEKNAQNISLVSTLHSPGTSFASSLSRQLIRFSMPMIILASGSI